MLKICRNCGGGGRGVGRVFGLSNSRYAADGFKCFRAPGR